MRMTTVFGMWMVGNSPPVCTRHKRLPDWSPAQSTISVRDVDGQLTPVTRQCTGLRPLDWAVQLDSSRNYTQQAATQ